MSDARDFGELFANALVRHSMELASTLWGVTSCVVGQDLTAHFPVIAPEPLKELFRSLLNRDSLREEFETHFAPLFVSSPDWTGPRWFQPCGGVRMLVTPVGATSGFTFLLCVPFVHHEESEEEDRTALLGLIRSFKLSSLKSGVEFVPVLSSLMRRRVQTHMSTLSREMDLLLSRKTRRSGDTKRRPQTYSGLLGESVAISEVKRRLKALASEDAPLLLQGEIGSGRRTAARALHAMSGRKSQPAVTVDCQATPPAHLVSNILGDSWRPGDSTQLDKIAANGTVIFHEVSFLPPLLQQFLLYYCDSWDSQGVRPFRVVVTSSYSASALENLDTLRAELLALLRGNFVGLPALRHRKGDIADLANDMLLRLRSLDPDAPYEFRKDVFKTLQQYDWPGNLWELKGEVRHMAASAKGRREIGVQDVSPRVVTKATHSVPAAVRQDPDVTLPQAVENLERSLLMETLSQTKWNKSKTAKVLGISRRNLIRKIGRYRLDRRKYGRDGDEISEEIPQVEEE